MPEAAPVMAMTLFLKCAMETDLVELRRLGIAAGGRKKGIEIT